MLRKSTTPKECIAVERMTRGNGREGARMDSKEKEKFTRPVTVIGSPELRITAEGLFVSADDEDKNGTQSAMWVYSGVRGVRSSS